MGILSAKPRLEHHLYGPRECPLLHPSHSSFISDPKIWRTAVFCTWARVISGLRSSQGFQRDFYEYIYTRALGIKSSNATGSRFFPMILFIFCNCRTDSGLLTLSHSTPARYFIIRTSLDFPGCSSVNLLRSRVFSALLVLAVTACLDVAVPLVVVASFI